MYVLLLYFSKHKSLYLKEVKDFGNTIKGVGIIMGDKLTIERYFSKGYGSLYKDHKGVMKYRPRNVEITNDEGEVMDKIEGAIFPVFWSQNSANTVATKYFRKEGVPKTKREIDIRQLVGRVSKKIADWGLEQGYITDKGAKNLESELAAASLFQYGAFNSPVWFNLGLDYYGITDTGDDTGYTIKNGKVIKIKNLYPNPQVSACFISSPEDSIENMMEVGAVISSNIFKSGSGVGGNWGKIRSKKEPISGGGFASGAREFMDVQDSVARVIKSGGKTRRAATMQILPSWHPDTIEMLKHKFKEEEKARILLEAGSPKEWESHTFQNLRGQNINFSVRTDDEFWEAYEKDEIYNIKRVLDGKVVRGIRARDYATMMAFATHNCGDPGMQNHDIINNWHTCKNSGEIMASNPCSEYMFIDDSACNLASINLLRFRKEDGIFDIDSFIKAVDLYITAQDILVSKASYPTEKIASNSHTFRPLGLGYANLGAYIMSLGLAYDSDNARDFASAVTSLMTAEAYLQSTRLAEQIKPFQEFEKNKEPMLEVMEMHRKASKKIVPGNGLEGILQTANEKWDQVIERGEKYGFRNANVTLLAPTGTIGFMMGCDTTGCEPTYSLKSYKELSGGGSMTIVNETVPMALEYLDYPLLERNGIIEYIDKNETIEGCEFLKEEHLPVFDCSVASGKGTRTISPMGHIRMLGAIQPFLSGAISKTINCPNNTNIGEIQDMFYQGWKLGIKALAIYRDGSKASQPLKTKKESQKEILVRGQREHMPHLRRALTQKVKIADTKLFINVGEYEDGRLGELFINSFERGTEINRLQNLVAVQFSEKLQGGMDLKEAIEIFSKSGLSQIVGPTNHPFIPQVKGIEDFLYKWISSHYLGDISFVSKEPELRPLPWELRIYQQTPKLHLIPSVAGEKFYPGVPSLEETIEGISGMNYWEDADKELDTRQTIEKIKNTREWSDQGLILDESSGILTGRACDKCGTMLINDGTCMKCPRCKVGGGCGGE